VATTSAGGFLALRGLAALRPLRRRGARYAEEQALAERWLAALLAVLGHRTPAARALALEIAGVPAAPQGLRRDPRARRRSFLEILDTLVAPPGEHPDDRATDADHARARGRDPPPPRRRARRPRRARARRGSGAGAAAVARAADPLGRAQTHLIASLPNPKEERR